MSGGSRDRRWARRHAEHIAERTAEHIVARLGSRSLQQHTDPEPDDHSDVQRAGNKSPINLRGAFWFLSLLTTIIALHRLWQTSPPWALLAFWAAVVGFTATALGPGRKGITAGVAVLAGFGALVLSHYIPPDQGAYSGELRADGGASPNAPDGVLLSARKHAVLEIGDGGSMFDWLGPEGTPMFVFETVGESQGQSVFERDQLVIERIDGQTKVSTLLRNRNGEVVAELVRNEWRSAKPPQSWDRNYSRDAVEIRDDRGDVVLQVRALPDRVQMQAVWFGPCGAFYFLFHAPGEQGGHIGGGPSARWPGPPAIERMFQYPSERHLGEFAKN